MKKIFYVFIPIVVLMFSSCYKKIDTPDNRSQNIVLAYPAVNNYNIASSGLNYWKKALLELDMGKATVPVNISINLPKASSQTVTVNIGVDQAAYDAYKANPVYTTQYALMPATYYQLPTTKIDMPAGKTDTTILINFKPSLMDISATGYLLPVSITSVTGGSVGSDLKTIYFHVEKDPFPPYSRANWTILGGSSEEATGEGPDNGHFIHMIDNSNSTFWHSKWQGGNDPLPYWITIDMHASNVLHGVILLPRQGVGSNGRPKNVTIDVSNDATTWTLAGNITVADNTNSQKFTFATPTAAARYLRITITSVYGDNISYSNLADLKAF